jgi:molecular chaperone GrpE
VEIESMKKEMKATKDKLLYEMAENDNTIKRYKKEMDSAKEFAISKFAKELLEVRDNLDRATAYLDEIKLDEEADIEQLKKHFKEVALGMNMTSSVMDSTLKKFFVVKFHPLNEKFDPNFHEAVYTFPDPTKENNTVGQVMQTGWKIGDRILRAAKVGIVKK